MTKFLRWLLNFIETRFPEKVVLTKADWDKVASRVTEYDHMFLLESQDTKAIQTRLIIIEAQLKKLSDLMDSRIENEELVVTAVSTIDRSIAALKEGIVKGEIRPGLTDREKERQDFVAGILPRNMPSRSELEAATNRK